MTFAVSFIAALLIGIANKISAGLWLWPNVLPDTRLIIYSLMSAFTLTIFLLGVIVEWHKGKGWLIFGIIGLIFSVVLSLFAKV